MASTQTLASINYLNDAAHLLYQAAPESSSYMMSQRNDLLRQQDMPLSDVQQQHACGSCGHIMVPGAGAGIKIQPRPRDWPQKKRQQPAQPPRNEAAGPVKVLSCSQCSRLTKIHLPAAEPATRQRSKRKTARSSLAHQETQEPKKPTANASSKKRAKNRKTGLQALLSGHQNQQNATTSLSLADFVKK